MVLGCTGEAKLGTSSGNFLGRSLFDCLLQFDESLLPAGGHFHELVREYFSRVRTTPAIHIIVRKPDHRSGISRGGGVQQIRRPKLNRACIQNADVDWEFTKGVAEGCPGFSGAWSAIETKMCTRHGIQRGFFSRGRVSIELSDKFQVG